MCAIVENQPAPSVRRVLCVPRVVHKRRNERVQTIIMACSAIRNIPRPRWVIQLIRISCTVQNRRITLINMEMASQDQINRVILEDRSKSVLTLGAYVVRPGTDVPRSVTR